MLRLVLTPRVLADDLPVPLYATVCFALATDNIAAFTRGAESVRRRALSTLDGSIAKPGIVRNERKDVNWTSKET